MNLVERAIFLAIGGGLGFILGYIVARLREIKEELDDVAEYQHKHDERGSFEWSFVNIALLVVLVVVVVASFSSQRVSNKVDHSMTCITKYNVHQGEALGSRDRAIKAGTASEIALWTKYAELYALAKADPTKIPLAQEALNKAVLSHRDALVETQETRSEHPYPNPDVLKDCKENFK